MFNGVKLKLWHAIWIFIIHTNCGIVLSCDIVILNEEVSFKRIFSAALVKGVREGCKANLCFELIFKKDPGCSRICASKNKPVKRTCSFEEFPLQATPL